MVYAPGTGTGFVSVGDYLDANHATLAREQGQITQDVGGQIDAAKSAADNVIAADKQNYVPDWTTVPGYSGAKDLITGAQNQANALGSHGGMSDYFQHHFGDTASQGAFDANILGYDPSGLQSRAAGLSDYLDTGLKNVPAPPWAPPPPTELHPAPPPAPRRPYDMPPGPPPNAPPPNTLPQYKPGTGPRHPAPTPGPGLWRPPGSPKRRP